MSLFGASNVTQRRQKTTSPKGKFRGNVIGLILESKNFRSELEGRLTPPGIHSAFSVPRHIDAVRDRWRPGFAALQPRPCAEDFPELQAKGDGLLMPNVPSDATFVDVLAPARDRENRLPAPIELMRGIKS
jgi:hypothetical protein